MVLTENVMKLRVLAGWIALLCLSGTVSPAHADLILSFSPTGTPITFSVVAGQTIAIPVYLVERNQAPLTNILSSEGLFSAGVRLNYDTIAGSATVIANGAVLNPAFNTNTSGFPTINNASGFAAVSGATTNFSGVPASGTPAAVLVGTFTFLGNQVGNVTTISTAKPQSLAFPEFLSNTTGTVLETESYANIFFTAGNTSNPLAYSTTITTISAVPEPATWGLLGCVGIGSIVAYRNWRKKQMKLAHANIELPDNAA